MTSLSLAEGTTTIVLDGIVDPLAALELRHQLHDACRDVRPQIHVDLREVESLHLSAVNALIRGLVDARANLGDLTVTAPAAGPVRRIISLTGLENRLLR